MISKIYKHENVILAESSDALPVYQLRRRKNLTVKNDAKQYRNTSLSPRERITNQRNGYGAAISRCGPRETLPAQPPPSQINALLLMEPDGGEWDQEQGTREEPGSKLVTGLELKMKEEAGFELRV
ncbi:hypothetical protein EVAR_82876_1 [Eumeta japonica]|uniref:Uncharacterized protein n=1 Tax=Eumeta variegata TaxID=151549 RepID=A0A4C1V3V3_EUMVA|nr:hypothetical protein EVAR_82876_1 [Eumeta japonica]